MGNLSEGKECHMLVGLGLILLLLGLFVGGVHVLFTIGLIVLIVGVVLYFFGGAPSTRGRRGYWW